MNNEQKEIKEEAEVKSEVSEQPKDEVKYVSIEQYNTLLNEFNLFKAETLNRFNNQPKQAEPKQEKTIDEMTPEELPIW